MSTDNYPECEVMNIDDPKDLPLNAWMVRPCEWYKDEYKECSRIRSRFHQYFIFGEVLDCSAWKRDFELCSDFRKNHNLENLQTLIDHELARQRERLATVAKNDIWEYRSEPPKDWLRELPAWFTEQCKGTFLEKFQQKAEAEQIAKKELQKPHH